MGVLDTRDELMQMLLTNLETYAATHTIADAKKDASNYGIDYPEVESFYDDDTISKFIIELKISYLNYKRIIPWKVASELEDLANKKWVIEKEFTVLAKKGFDKLTPKERTKMNLLYQKLMDIDTVLKSYHLLPTSEELLETLITRLEHADYSKSSLDPVQKEKK